MDFERLVTSLKLKKREIYRSDKQPYLTRYYLFRKTSPWMPSIYIHCFHASDEDLELHNHPWEKSISIILSGKYKEEYLDSDKSVKERILEPGAINFIAANKFHRIDLITKTVWTLFISGKRIQKWGFWDRFTNTYRDWEEHLRYKQQSVRQGKQWHPMSLLKDYPLSLSEIFNKN